jgi:hypothetical protein
MGRRVLASAVVIALAAGCTIGGTNLATGSEFGFVTKTAPNSAAGARARLTDMVEQVYDRCMAHKGLSAHVAHRLAGPATYHRQEAIAHPTDGPDNPRKCGDDSSPTAPTRTSATATEPDPFDEQPDVRRVHAEGQQVRAPPTAASE